jgi:hypothetical protein
VDGASSTVDVVTLVMGEPATAKNAVRRDGIQDVPVEQIDDNPFQPRVEYSGIEELAADIAANGLLQVPKGRRTADGRVQLQYGHRRLRAIIALGWTTMPVEVQSLIVDHVIILQPQADGTRIDAYGLDLPAAIDELRRALLHLVATQSGVTIISTTVGRNMAVLAPPAPEGKSPKPPYLGLRRQHDVRDAPELVHLDGYDDEPDSEVE